MPEFRFEGATLSGKQVYGIIRADKLKEARARAKDLSQSKKFYLNRILPQRLFIYKARKGIDKLVNGEQRAFSKDDVRNALEKLGYKVLKIYPKLFSFRLRPPTSEIVTFVRVSADLMHENLHFNEILQLLVNDIENYSLREAVKEINSDLSKGTDSEEAFVKQEQYLGKFTARMLGLASKSGNMAAMYESTATFLERDMEFKKSIKSALVMPIFTLLILFGAVIYYIAYIFPQTANLFVRMGIELPPMTSTSLDISNFLFGNMIWLSGLTLATGIAALLMSRTTGFKLLKDKLILKIPVLGVLIHKTTIEIFCRVFNALYTGAGESVEAIRLSAEACGNSYFERRIKTISIPLMLSKGVGLVQAFEEAGVFTKTALSRFNSGAETGTLKQSSLQIANYYEKETVYKLKNIVELIQIFVAMIIMVVMTALTMVSSETATIRPKQF